MTRVMGSPVDLFLERVIGGARVIHRSEDHRVDEADAGGVEVDEQADQVGYELRFMEPAAHVRELNREVDDRGRDQQSGGPQAKVAELARQATQEPRRDPHVQKPEHDHRPARGPPQRGVLQAEMEERDRDECEQKGFERDREQVDETNPIDRDQLAPLEERCDDSAESRERHRELRDRQQLVGAGHGPATCLERRDR